MLIEVLLSNHKHREGGAERAWWPRCVSRHQEAVPAAEDAGQPRMLQELGFWEATHSKGACQEDTLDPPRKVPSSGNVSPGVLLTNIVINTSKEKYLKGPEKVDLELRGNKLIADTVHPFAYSAFMGTFCTTVTTV